jgi:hypothetical protein
MCKWCKKEKRTFWEHDPDGEGVLVYVEPVQKEIFIYSNPLCSDINVHLPIRFCPMCGRKFE